MTDSKTRSRKLRLRSLALAVVGYASSVFAALRYPAPVLFWGGFIAFLAGSFAFADTFDDQKEWGS